MKKPFRWFTRFFLLVVLLACFFPLQAACKEGVRNILILHSYHRGLGWTDSVARGIDDIVSRTHYPIETFTEYMDTKRIFHQKYLDDLALFLKDKYKNRKFDVIISSDDHAFQFLKNHHTDIFPDTPVVFCGVNYFKDEAIRLEPYFTGVVESFSIQDTIRAALVIHPKLKRVYSVVDQTISGKATFKSLEQVISLYRDQLEFITITDKDMTEVIDEVSHLPADSIVFLCAFTSDKSGNTFSLERSADLITTASDQPVYSSWDFFLNHGIVGGMLTSGYSQGTTAAELALRILGGEEPKDIPVIKESPNHYIFDYTVLKKFDIPVRKLPPDSTVINRPHSFYESHKQFVWAILAAFAGLLIFILILSVNILRRRQIEKELVKHRDHLEELVEDRTSELMDSNRALKESEERYRCLSDASFEGILISDQGMIIEANNALVNMFGYPLEGTIGREAAGFLSPDKREDVRQKVTAGYSKAYETVGMKKDGTRFPIQVQGKEFSYKGKQVRVSAIRDLTKQRKAEEEIKKLRGLLPICSNCKKIRDENGEWNPMETYIEKRSDAAFSHGMCPECSDQLYGKEAWYQKMKQRHGKGE